MLLPIVLTVYIMWWFLEFFDGFFSPLYVRLRPLQTGLQIHGLVLHLVLGAWLAPDP